MNVYEVTLTATTTLYVEASTPDEAMDESYDVLSKDPEYAISLVESAKASLVRLIETDIEVES